MKSAIEQSSDIFLLPTDRSIEMVQVNNIVRIQAISNYSKLYFADGSTLVVAKVLRWLEEKLSPQQFVRIHRTHIINKRCIRSYIHGSGGKICLFNGELIDVSKRRKAFFLQQWKADMTGIYRGPVMN